MVLKNSLSVRYVVSLLFLSLSIVSNAWGEKLKVAASISPLGSIVQEIGGNEVEVFTLLAKNVSPHVYEPAPRDVIRLRESKAFFLIGLDLEPWAEKLVWGKNENELRTIKVGSFMSHEKEERDEGTGQHHHHSGVNPHIWLSVEYAGEIAGKVYQELSLLKPEAKESFALNHAKFIKKLDALQQEMEALRIDVKDLDVRVITFHDSFAYFFKALGIKKVKAIEPFPGKKPSLRRLKKLVDFMQGGAVRAVFTEPQFSGRMTDVIVSETGAKKSFLDPVGCPSCEGREGYFPLMHYNIKQVKDVVGEKKVVDAFGGQL